MNLPNNFRFNQGNLQDYLICPKRFKLRHLERVSWPAQETQYDQEFEIRQQLGTRFHLFVQRFISGLPKKTIADSIDNPLLTVWWQNFVKSASNRFDTGIPYSEYSLIGQIDDSQTIAKFDLIHIDDGDTITIYDWKTSKNLPKPQTIQEKIQTRLYLYLFSKYGHILTNSTPIDPAKLHMIYWYAEHPAQEIRIDYSKTQQLKDEIYLTDLIQDIKQTSDEGFLETENKRMCTYCAFRSYCEKENAVGVLAELNEEFELDADDFNIDISFDDLDEVVYG